jgi:hypothetical protein
MRSGAGRVSRPRTWCGDSPSRKADYWEPLQACGLFEQMEWRLDVLGVRVQLLLRHYAGLADLACDSALMTHRLHNITRTSFPLGADESRPLGYASEGLAEVSSTADEWHLERVFIDVVFFVRGRQHFRLVDVVNPDALHYLRRRTIRR